LKLISIDGGGIKGLYSATALAKIEERYNVRIDGHVDVIAGTSIGGIIALGLAAGKRPSEMVEFFLKHGSKIFSSGWFGSYFRRLFSLVRPLYRNTKLKEACKAFFGNETRLKDLSTRAADGVQRPSVCIPTVNLGTGRPKVFKTPHHESLYLDKNYRVWEVALATAAAPYFFPVFKLTLDGGRRNAGLDEYYIDGGVWGNNPIMVALTEALTYAQSGDDSEPSELSKIQLLSIGNVPEPMGEATLKSVSRGFLQWGERLVTLPLHCQTETADNMARLLLTHNQGAYLRIANDGKLTPEQNALIVLDKASHESLNMLMQLANDDVSRITAHGGYGDLWIRSFFGL